MATLVSARLDADGNSQAFYDTNTQETLVRLLPVVLDEDFVGAGHSSIPAAGAPATGYPWVKKIVGTAPPTLAIVADSAAGIVQAALTTTSEKEEATLYANDQLNWDVTKGAIFEARAALTVLPSASGVEAVLGLQSAWEDGPDNASFYVRFQAEASGAINVQSKDGVNTFSLASGVTLAAGAFHNFRIDASDVNNVYFYVDGVRVNGPGTITFAATGANAILQPYASMYKPSGTGVGTMEVDMIQVSANRV